MLIQKTYFLSFAVASPCMHPSHIHRYMHIKNYGFAKIGYRHKVNNTLRCWAMCSDCPGSVFWAGSGSSSKSWCGSATLNYLCFDDRCLSSSRRWILPSAPGPPSTTYSPPTSTPSSTAFGRECRQASSSGSVTCSWMSRETGNLIVPAFAQGQGLQNF